MQTLIKSTSYADALHEEQLHQFEQKMLTHFAVLGKQNGTANIPVSDDQLLPLAINSIEASVQEQINLNQQKHLPISGSVVAHKIETDAKTKVQELQRQQNGEELSIEQLKTKEKELRPDKKKKRFRKITQVVIWLLSAIEGYMVFEGLSAGSFPFWTALTMALLFSISVGFATHYFAKVVCEAKSTWKKLLYYALILVPMAGISYLAGHLRAGSYNSIVNLDAAVGNIVLAPASPLADWQLAVYSFITFCIALFLSIKIYISKEERSKEKAYEDVCNDLKSCEEKIGVIEQKKNAISDEAKHISAQALARFEYAKMIEERLKTMARKFFAVFVENNLRFRSDGIIPQCLSKQPQFSFTTFFNTQKTQP
jgi:hypothetical protein